MLIKKYKHFLFYNKLVNESNENSQEMFEKIKYNNFNLSEVNAKRRSLQCDESVSLESNYMINNISK